MEGDAQTIKVSVRSQKTVTVKISINMKECVLLGISIEGDFFAENPEPIDELIGMRAVLSREGVNSLLTRINSSLVEAGTVGLDIAKIIKVLRKNLEEVLELCAKK
ncbi:MAG: hypothetical protein J7L55_01945 [Desulfurococcales archaeon]|nr:hypothetical protein [Desulfurococcales archaeon]